MQKRIDHAQKSGLTTHKRARARTHTHVHAHANRITDTQRHTHTQTDTDTDTDTHTRLYGDAGLATVEGGGDAERFYHHRPTLGLHVKKVPLFVCVCVCVCTRACAR